MARLVDSRTKLSAAPVLRTSSAPTALADVRAIADGSGYEQPDGHLRSLLLVDGAQLVPSNPVDVTALDVDWMSFHKILAPFGVGVLYGKEDLISQTRPFLYGGDMIADGGVWDDASSTPTSLAIGGGHPSRPRGDRVGPGAPPLVDMVSGPDAEPYFRTERP